MVSPAIGCARSARQEVISRSAFIRISLPTKKPRSKFDEEAAGPGDQGESYFFVFLYSRFSLPWRASMLPWAAGALGPLGWSLRYVWKASMVPGAGTIVPSGLTTALPMRAEPYQYQALAFVASRSVAFFKATAASSICPRFTRMAPRL